MGLHVCEHCTGAVVISSAIPEKLSPPVPVCCVNKASRKTYGTLIAEKKRNIIACMNRPRTIAIKTSMSKSRDVRVQVPPNGFMARDDVQNEVHERSENGYVNDGIMIGIRRGDERHPIISGTV